MFKSNRLNVYKCMYAHFSINFMSDFHPSPLGTLKLFKSSSIATKASLSSFCKYYREYMLVIQIASCYIAPWAFPPFLITEEMTQNEFVCFNNFYTA